jgi:hypothetical protein
LSTNLNEQRQKAREIVQTFAQMTDYLLTGEKKPWKAFASHACLRQFDKHFRYYSLERFLFHVGFNEPLRRLLLNKHRKTVEAFYSLHTRLERVKTNRKLRKVADGVHRPAILNLRAALAMMPRHLSEKPACQTVDSREIFAWILSSQAVTRDRKMPETLRRDLQRWQQLYLRMLGQVTTPTTWKKTVELIKNRATIINFEGRITGNALIHIVDEILRYRRRGLSDAEVQSAIEELIETQTLNPDFALEGSVKNPGHQRAQPLMRSLLSVVHGFREDI